MTAGGLLALLLHLPLMAAAALGLAGLGPLIAAKAAGRAGPGLFQPWHEWRHLLRKRPVRPESASPLMAAAPLVYLAVMSVVAVLVPSFSLDMLTSPAADLIVIAGLLALARAVLSLAALDAGSSPGAIAAFGTLRAALLAEPALLVVVLILALLTGSTNLNVALGVLRDTAPGASIVLAVAGVAVIIAAGETMAEPTSGGFSGWHQAALEAGVALRRVAGLSLLAALVLPASLASPGFDAVAWLLAILAWVLKLAALGAASALAGQALRRFVRQPALSLLGVGLLLVLLGLVVLLAGGELA